MFGVRLSKMGSASKLGLVAKAIAILRKYGTDAHVYLPGFGTVSGLTAGNYLDSAGTTAASVDNPVGLSLDALQAMTLGPQLITGDDSTFTSGTGSWTSSSAAVLTAVAGLLCITSSGTSYPSALLSVAGLVVGQLYVVTGSMKRGTCPGNASIGVSGVTQYNNATTVLNTISFDFVATATTHELFCQIIGASAAGETAYFDSITLQQIPGIHATQATTANKPILRLNSGKYSWQFDGSNDSLGLSAPLFQMSDDHCVIAGFKADAANKYIFSHSNSGTVTQCCSLRVDASGYPGAVWIDDASANALPTATTSCIGLSTVATAIKIGNAKRLRVNGVQAGATNNTALGVGTTNSYAIGCLNVSSGNFQGSIYPLIGIKGTVSDAELLVLERYVGMGCGVSI